MVMPLSPTRSGQAPSRIVALDALRAVAVLLVVGHHTAFRFRPDMADPVAAVFRNTGWIGVDVFFAISGFMITAILVRDADDIGGFFRRRFFRIVPIFTVAVGVFVVASLVTGTQADILGRIWSPALFLNGWTIPFFGAENVPFKITWSLSVEETAYILMGLACFAAKRHLRIMLVAMLVVALVTRWVVVATGAFDLVDLYFFVPARLDAIAVGGFVALGYLHRVVIARSSAWLFAIAVVALILLFQHVDIDAPFMPVVGYAMFGFATAGLVGALANRADCSKHQSDIVPGFFYGWLINLGQLSYFVYLFHMFVIEALGLVFRALPVGPIGFWPGFVLAVLITHALAMLSWRYFEHPLIRYGRTGRRVVQKPKEERS